MGTVAILVIEANLSRDLAVVLDRRITEILDQSREVADLDAFGYFDRAEHVTGLGFVMLQTYITTVCGIFEVAKNKALILGPLHRGGRPVAKVVNDAANYWKHNSEWRAEKSGKRRRIIEKTFDDVGFPIGADYPLAGIITELSSPNCASFGAVFKLLEEWTNEVEQSS